MKRASIRVQEPTPELIEKIRRARVAISQQKPRYLKCPYCQHNAIAVYEDTRGHVESKCKKCGRITVFDVLNPRSTECAHYKPESETQRHLQEAYSAL